MVNDERHWYKYYSSSSKLPANIIKGRGTQSTIPNYVWFSLGGTTFLGFWLYYAFMDEVPLTKRKRWIATSKQWECKLGHQEYNNLLKLYRKDILPSDHRASITLHRVGNRIADAATIFANQHNSVKTTTTNNSKQAPATPYTYTVVRSDVANAFVLPGNHVFLMTGLFQYVRDEDELAIILGHEVAHNIARHAGEKISGSIVTMMLARLSLLLDPSGFTLSILLPSATIFRSLPNSRVQEMEADEIGLQIAVEACYDPRAAKRVFQRMMNEENITETNQKTRKGPPEFLSTHPSYDTRISNFDKWLPDAMEKFQGNDGQRCRHIREQMKRARQIAAEQATVREAVIQTRKH